MTNKEFHEISKVDYILYDARWTIKCICPVEENTGDCTDCKNYEICQKIKAAQNITFKLLEEYYKKKRG